MSNTRGVVTLICGVRRRGREWWHEKPPNLHHRHRFPADLISHAVWLYHLFSLSFRDVKLLLAERGIIVSYESIR